MLFLDEPFEGVDAIASRTLKDLLSRLTERGLTVFLTSHVLEMWSGSVATSPSFLKASCSRRALSMLKKNRGSDGDASARCRWRYLFTPAALAFRAKKSPG